MRSEWGLLICFCLLLVTGPGASAQEVDLMHYQVSNLNSGASTTLEQFRGKPTIMLLFEPGCRYCARQSRILNGMLRECQDFQAVALGFNDSRRRMLDYLDKLRPDFPAYMAGQDLAYDMGEIVITPVLLLADAAGSYQLHLLGLQDRERLYSLLGQVGAACQ